MKLKILAAAQGLTLDALMTDAAGMYIQQNRKYIHDVFTDQDTDMYIVCLIYSQQFIPSLSISIGTFLKRQTIRWHRQTEILFS